MPRILSGKNIKGEFSIMISVVEQMELRAMLSPIVDEIMRDSKNCAPYIIGIGGGAGVGKTAFSDFLKNALAQKGKSILVIRLDDFFKSPEERQRLGTEWDERHVNMAEARKMLEKIKRGERIITKPKYSRETGKIETEALKISGVDIVIFEGIYAISDELRLGRFLEFIDLPLFMSAKVRDIKKWRFRQESEKPHPRSKEQMESHWNLGILPDLRKNILPSKKNARFLIDVDPDHGLSLKFRF